MTLDILIDGRHVPLHLEPAADAWRVNGREASALEVEPGVYSVLLAGRSFDARLERVEDALFIHIAGRRMEVEVVDPRRSARKGGALRREGRQKITAPMPGKVVRVLVTEGEAVEAGQGLIVVEAMKMQNEIKAPKAGRVVSLAAREAATVGAGEILAVIE